MSELAPASTMDTIRKQFTVQKLFFYIAFWVFHFGIFAYGWCASFFHLTDIH